MEKEFKRLSNYIEESRRIRERERIWKFQERNKLIILRFIPRDNLFRNLPNKFCSHLPKIDSDFELRLKTIVL